MPGALSRGGDGPGVLLIPAIFGVGEDEEARVRELPVPAICVDPFHRVLPGPLPFAQVGRALSRARQVDRERLLDDLTATARWLKTLPGCNGRVVAVGICFGGRYAWWLGARGEVDGVCAWHGGGLGNELDLVDALPDPIDLHFGADDGMIPEPEVRAIREALRHRPHARVELHPGAGHGFSHRRAPSRYEGRANAAAEAGLARVISELR